MYYLPLAENVDKVNSVKSMTLERFHQVMGHANVCDLLKLEHVVYGVKITDPNTKFFCEICTVGKQSRDVINKAPDKRAEKVLELVHSDLCGPLTPVAKDGFSYGMCFVDDFSGMMFHYFLKKKSDAHRAAAKFLADVSHIGSVKVMRTDNGGEFESSDFKELLVKNNIKHEHCAPHSPHQNGTAERNWQTVFNMAQCLILDGKLPKSLWTYAVAYAGYTRNRCYQQRTKCTPFELFYGKVPDLRHMASFGTKCYVYDENTKKLDNRSTSGVFVGYDRESPAYLVYNTNSGAIRRSRNVRFNELPDHSPMQREEVPNSIDNADSDKPVEALAPEPVEALVDARPKRDVKKPAYLDDYDQANGNIDFCYRMCVGFDIPKSYEEAVKSPDAEHWRSAMRDEYESLTDNNTWTVKPLPTNQSVVGGKWVYDVKLNKDNEIKKFKARYVARGFSQISGVNYFETFAPTARLTSVRVLMQLSVQHDLFIHQLDVKTAYLNAPIDCNIYVKQPEGFEIPGDNKVCHLNKSLYGLKQSGRNWNNLLHNFLFENDYIRSNVDHCLYIKKYSNAVTYVLIWVDDILVASSNMNVMNNLKMLLHNKFKMVDLGKLDWFLGIEFYIENDCIKMCQSQYLRNVLKRFGMELCKPSHTPCNTNLKDVFKNGDTYVNNENYRSAVGSLIYAMICTRPDLSWIVTKLSQFVVNPTEEHWVAVKHVFRYLQHTLDYSICFRKDPKGLTVIGYSDADWASNDAERRSTSGYCFSLNTQGCVISWKSKRQQSVALSSCEAEYMALASATQEALYLIQLLKEVDPNYDPSKPVVINEDNQSAIALVNNPVNHARTKHINIRYHFIREQVIDNNINIKYLPTASMVADCLTKPIGRVKLQFCNTVLFGK